MKRLISIAALAAGALILATVPRWIFSAVAAPKSGAKRKPTAADRVRHAESTKERKRM